jgi:y4mF family transcriptional regulator
MRKTRVTTTHDLASAVTGRRIELGLTQSELAERAGVSRDWVNSFERGKRTVELALVLRVFDALGVGMELMQTQAPEAMAGADDAKPGLDDILDKYLNQ